MIKARYGPTTMASAFQLLNLFGIFWGIFFVEAFGQVEHIVLPKSQVLVNLDDLVSGCWTNIIITMQLVLAGAFAGWYWTFDKKKRLPSNGDFLS